MQNLKALNEERKKAGLPALVYNEEYSKIATLRAKEMFETKYFEHDLPKYGIATETLAMFGYKHLYANENLATGMREGDIAVAAWMTSPGHKGMMLNDFKPTVRLAIGVYGEKWSDDVYWVNMFVEDYKNTD